MSSSPHTGVIVVDIQGDFTEAKNGSLAVSGTDMSFVRSVAAATRSLKDAGFTVFATQDWHPADHVSFYTNHPGRQPFEAIDLGGRSQVLWPPHCVQGTDNAEIMIDTDLFRRIIRKGQDREFDSYSGFQDDGGQKTQMDAILKQQGIEKVVVYGIATDYCVRATAIDAAQAGYEVIVITELCRGVSPETSATAWDDMKEAGVIVMETLDVNSLISP